MRSYYFFLILFFSSFGSFAGPYVISDVARAQVSTQGLLANLRATAIINSKASYVSRVVSVGKSSIALAVKSRIFSPWGIALAAAFVAADYILDENTGSITTINPVSAVTGNCSYSGTSLDIVSCMNLSAYYPSDPYNNWYVLPVWNSSTSRYDITIFRILDDFNAGVQGSWIPSSYQGENPLGGEDAVLDSQIADYFLEWSSPEAKKDILVDPVTGLPDMTIPEIVATEADINADYDALNDGDPLTVPTIDISTGDTGLDTESEIKPKEEDVCIINPDLLECLTVGDELVEQSVPVSDVPFSFTPFSLSSTGSCPVPMTAVLLNGESVSFSYSFLCDFAGAIRFIILAICSLIALRLMSGAVKQ